MHVERLRTAAEVLTATGHDPFARSLQRTHEVSAWRSDGATAWLGLDAEERIPYLSALGAPADVAALLAALLADLPPGQRVTLPRGTPAHLPAGVRVHAVDWDFRWTDAPPPPQRGEERVQPLDDEVAVATLLTASSPRASARPGDDEVRRWVGVRDDDGTLLACAADTTAVDGVGHLSSIAVAPAARGRGLAKAVTAALTRQLLAEGCDIVTLGMYADTPQARAVYTALGFADDHPFSSGPLEVGDAERATGITPERRRSPPPCAAGR